MLQREFHVSNARQLFFPTVLAKHNELICIWKSFKTLNFAFFSALTIIRSFFGNQTLFTSLVFSTLQTVAVTPTYYLSFLLFCDRRLCFVQYHLSILLMKFEPFPLGYLLYTHCWWGREREKKRKSQWCRTMHLTWSFWNWKRNYNEIFFVFQLAKKI